MRRLTHRLAGLTLLAFLVLQHTDRTPAQGTTVAAAGDHFTVNGVPMFLLMASYFDALHTTSAAWAEDLDYLRAHGYNGVRIFPNWFDVYCAPGGSLPDMDGTLFNHSGSPRLNSTTLQKLQSFLTAAAARGLVVDVTLGWDTVPDASGQMKTMDHDDYVAAVAATTNALRGYSNVIIDVQNEYERNALPVTRAAQAVTAVHAQDSGRKASASRGQPPGEAANEARVHGFDFVAYHDFRDSTWYTGTDISADIDTIKTALGASAKPIDYQEPMPFDEFPGCGNSQKDPTPGHHRTAAANAKRHGAAAWTFHTRLSFELSGTSLKQRLQGSGHASERAELEAVASSVSSVCWGGDVVSITPQAATVPAGGGNGSFSIAMNGACNTGWTVTSDAGWLTATPANGNGNGPVTYTAAPNGGVARVGHLTVRGRMFTVSQAALAPTQAPDFNGDGYADLIWQHRNSDGLLAIWFMNGINKVDDALLTPSSVADPQWHIVGAGDYNRDGRPDLFWQHQTTGELAVWRMGGTSGTQQIVGESLEPSSVSDTNWKVRTVADMDRDGYPDLIWQNVATGDLSVWWMNGRTRRAGDGGQPLIPGSVAPNTTWTIVGAGDVNRDGYPDLVWHKLDEGLVSVWFMQGRTQLSGQSITPNGVADLNWKVRGVGDLDRNGYPDLIWQNISTREVSAWLMTGLSLTAGELLMAGSANPVPDTNWTVVAPK